MKPLSLFRKSKPLKAVTIFFLVNRFQVFFLLLVFPEYMASPHLIWLIIVLGLLSQGNLFILSKWLSTTYAAKGYLGFVDLFGEWKLRLFTAIALVPVLVKVSFLTINYVAVTRQYIFPSISPVWLIVVFLLISMYVAIKGMENTIRFSIITFFIVIWMILMFLPFFFPPNAAWFNLLPLTSTLSHQSWKGIMFIWASLSGPEYLICLVPWLKQDKKVGRYLTWANILTIGELLIVLITSLLFFGQNYLKLIKLPYIEMTRYLQSPVFERIDMVVISFYLFHFVFMIAILLLFFYGGVRIIFNKTNTKTTRKGFFLSTLLIAALILFLYQILWTYENQFKVFMNIDIWVSGFTYLFIPSFLVIYSKIKGGSRR
ncbi:GerAB/ArcD/ProY family transporter [Peribacillus sp. FSL H8-0477]|uniref:GerAB/ArcD/ProY family transporter n=1 Tax=Peribacillus sp. FSL H8-0477 TaxID=2921388 RepID=UPI0030F87616